MPILIQSSLCQCLTVVGGKHRLPVLKAVMLNEKEPMCWEYYPPAYIPLAQPFLETVEVYITEKDGVTPAFKSGTSHCVLHLRQVE